MTSDQLIKLAIVAAFVAFVWYLTRRATAYNIEQLRGLDSSNKLIPESLYTVTVTDTHIRHDFPDGEHEQLEWSDLHQFEIHTTDEGPFLPDVFWILRGTKSTCRIAQGATGESDLLDRLQQLPDFDNDKLIEAMASVSNQRFICWQQSNQ